MMWSETFCFATSLATAEEYYVGFRDTNAPPKVFLNWAYGLPMHASLPKNIPPIGGHSEMPS